MKKDYHKAVDWLKKAVDQGYAQAQNHLAAMYENGWGVKQDYSKAYLLYSLAAAQGDFQGRNNLEWLNEHLSEIKIQGLKK